MSVVPDVPDVRVELLVESGEEGLGRSGPGVRGWALVESDNETRPGLGGDAGVGFVVSTEVDIVRETGGEKKGFF